MCNTPQKTLRKALSLAMAVLWICGLATPAMSAPQGGKVIGGDTVATITQSGNLTTIKQSAQSAVINWLSFSVKPKETVSFLNEKYGASSITLNRVTGTEQSLIQGTITATGRVFLINSNGILFSKDSSVNAAGFLASTLDITNDNFNAGAYVFTANGSKGSVVNKGSITAKDYVALLGRSVSNQGTITATRGTVALASGDKITLNFNGDSLMGLTVDEGTLKALVENKGAIYADGGTVIMTAKAAEDLLTAQVNNTGLIQARTIGDLKGSIELAAQGGTTRVSGTLDASGGSILTSGNKVIIGDAAVTTRSDSSVGTWNITSDQFTLAGKGFTNSLDNTNITVKATDIRMNHEAGWSGNTTLALNAANDIYINRSLVATGAYANLALNYGGDYHILTPASYSGAVLNAYGMPVAKRNTSGGAYGSIILSGSDATLKLNGTAYTLIRTKADLDNINSTTPDRNGYTAGRGYYALAANLDLSGTTYTNSPISTLSGTLTGLGNTVRNMAIRAPSSKYTGFVGQATAGSLIRDIGVVNADVSGRWDAKPGGLGVLAGIVSGGTVSHAYATGSVSGYGALIGGLIGRTEGSAVISDSFSNVQSAKGLSDGLAGLGGGLIGTMELGASVLRSHATGDGASGGLIGQANVTSISDCYATGKATVGGLVGRLTGGSLVNSFATGQVTGSTTVGGLVGQISGGGTVTAITIDNCYATGNVIATYNSAVMGGIGGLIGLVTVGSATFTISNSHATGNVIVTGLGRYGDAYTGGVGGLVGMVLNAGETVIQKSYASGNVIAPNMAYVGGLAGWLLDGNSHISDSHATGNVVGGLNVPFEGFVGGLVGGMVEGTIDNSWQSGTVTGPGGFSLVGGLVGAGTVAISNSYWNKSNGLDAAGSDLATLTNVTGLFKGQFGDIRYYMNGTIDQVLADRAATAAAKAAQVAAEVSAANAEAGGTMGRSVQHDRDSSSEADGAAVLAGRPSGTLDSHIVFADSDSYSAHIKAISADGVGFELEEDSGGKKK